MTDVRVIQPFTMLPGAGPACEGDDCLPAVDIAQSEPAGGI